MGSDWEVIPVSNKRFITVSIIMVLALLLITVSSPASFNAMAAETEVQFTAIINDVGFSPAITPTNTPVSKPSGVYQEPAYTTAAAGAQRAEEIKRVLAKYNPTGIYIIECRAGEQPVNDFISRWCFDINGVFGDLDMAVHEEYHGFQFIRTGSQHIVGGSVVAIPFSRDKIIPTEEATSKIPETMRTNRWSTYVAPGSEVSANLQGAYGLLDELSAYYYGCRAVIDCTEYLSNYVDINGYSYELVSGYFCSIDNSIQAFYEFNYWTLEYLLFIKEHYPDHYKSIMSNESYRKAYSYFYDNFLAIENDYAPKNKKAVIDKLNSINVRASEDENTVWLKSTGIQKPTAEIKRLKKELSRDKYVMMLNELVSPYSVYVPASARTSYSTPAPASLPQVIPAQTVSPTPSTVYINGEEQFFEAYLINDSNYFKLRDLAFVLGDTNKKFYVGYDDATKAVTMTRGLPYIRAGDEMTRGDGKAKTAVPTPSQIYLDGKELSFTVYNIGGNNFFKLRDLLSALDIGVTYDSVKSDVVINTHTRYMKQ